MKSNKKITNLLDTHLFKLVHLKQLITGKKFKQIHYSQFGEDIILRNLFPNKEGFYVDIGSFHPVHYSNTHQLHKRGWRGINVDPNSLSIKLFNKYRPHDINLNVGIAPKEDKQAYFVYNHQSCNTFSRKQVEKNKEKSFLKLLKEEQIQCVPLSVLFKEHLPNGTKVDLLNIDVEGLDLEVLKTNDWNIYKPKVIIVESEIASMSTLTKSELYTFMRDKGYDLVAWAGPSLIFSLNTKGK